MADGHESRTGALHLAVSWLTVIPVPQPRTAPGRTDGGRVIAAVPVLGLILGIACAAIAFGLAHTELPTLIVGALCVVFLALVTRGMHLDGLADTADGLGCYGDAERIRAVMRSGDVGPFGAATLVLVLLLQATAFGSLAGQERWFAIAFAVFLGRLTVVIACRAGVGPANADGFGALVAGTQRTSIVLWILAAAALAVGAGWLDSPTAPDSFTAAPTVIAVLAVAAVAVFAALFTRHCARRMSGISGDVLGAGVEVGTALALVLLLV